jgi:archaellum component FlaC
MVITTVSKLILAQDEIEDLKNEYASMEAAYELIKQSYVESYNKLERNYVEQSKIIEELRKEIKDLKYDRDNPWWKFW